MTKYNRSNIVVRGLPEGITEEKLRSKFDQFGNILSVKIIEKEGRRPFAYILYDNVKDAQRAI